MFGYPHGALLREPSAIKESHLIHPTQEFPGSAREAEVVVTKREAQQYVEVPEA